MNKNVLITGGAGFIGSNLAIMLKEKYPKSEIICFDNLKRRGSELNLKRLKEKGIEFMHGDIRNKEDFEQIPDFDLMIECSAEPSVMAGINSSPSYLLNTNLMGTINCLEECRKKNASLIFLSTSRVYPIDFINSLDFNETNTRFEIKENQKIKGASNEGISEDFSLDKARSLYGATKLCSELLIREYADSYGLKAIINRCGVISGPWQMGKIDQGVMALWVAKHLFNQELSYIGFGGSGKQVRDFLNISDLFELIDLQINDFSKFKDLIYNVGGGKENSFSLKELTNVCEELTGNKIKIKSVPKTRQADVKWFITDSNKIKKISGWRPKKKLKETIIEIIEWMNENKENLKLLFV
ncbi:MAG: NAD-dependent epimerase/dehydratase family protein [Candidatus Nanoarchaeia archaeon]|nr:NAD-dependent epimerase/dehydratase family protein [Candidatus Nanoarchaeia archaeon]